MSRKPNPLLKEFFDQRLSLPAIHWETVPAGINPYTVWDAYDDGVDGWVPVWYPFGDEKTGVSYKEFERSYYFNNDLERILRAMHRWPLWGSPTQKKHAAAIALVQLFCELMGRCPRV
ncbi:MAG: hypothetical protein ACOC6E_00480 [Thermodesulfobacteriota bacterium]